MKTEEIKEHDLKMEAPVLFGMERRNVFHAPDGYFETLTSKIQDRIAAEKKMSILDKLIEMFFAPQSLIPVAASVVIIAFIFNANNYTAKDNTAGMDITYTELEQSGYIQEIDEQIITEAYLLADNSNAENELETFLIENNINEDLLNEALNSN